MRGGVRAGAGRKPSEPTIRVRVPESLLPKVQALIDDHKKAGTEIKLMIQPDVPSNMENGASIKVTGSAPKAEDVGRSRKGGKSETPLTPEQKKARKSLERLHKDVQEQIRAKYGTLTQAVRAGVRVSGKQASLPKVF